MGREVYEEVSDTSREEGRCRWVEDGQVEVCWRLTECVCVCLYSSLEKEKQWEKDLRIRWAKNMGSLHIHDKDSY